MQYIKLSKLKDARYNRNSVKAYEVQRGGVCLGYVAQDVSLSCWQVQDTWGVPLSEHHSIKKAVKVAGQVLS